MRAVILALFFSLVGAAWAQPAPEAQAVISSQLDAFAHDDARAAFGLASPPIQQRFSSPEVFLAMVRRVYPAVYRHRSVVFGDAARQGDKIEQGVVFVDDDNAVWNGVYTLTRQSDGGWKIEGCVIAPSEQTSL